MKMASKRLVSVRFEEREELNTFVNNNHIARGDVVDIHKNWNWGSYDYTLTFYATPEIQPALLQQRNHRKTQLAPRLKDYIMIALFFAALIIMAIGIKQG